MFSEASTSGRMGKGRHPLRHPSATATLACLFLTALLGLPALSQPAYVRPAQTVELKYAGTGFSFSTAPLLIGIANARDV